MEKFAEGFSKLESSVNVLLSCKKKGLWDKILKMLVKKTRTAQGRNEEPTYALIDSQSVKTTAASENRGYDGGKKRKDANDIS